MKNLNAVKYYQKFCLLNCIKHYKILNSKLTSTKNIGYLVLKQTINYTLAVTVLKC